MTFEEETRQMFSSLIERMNRIEANVAHIKPLKPTIPESIKRVIDDTTKALDAVMAAYNQQSQAYKVIVEDLRRGR
ncbi:hypothetical protein ASF00_09425 [Sphingomonas sp. Leaf34]|uniref:hypothetical protein n=1 Tax=Sphingomonas sp. Leaf34 TaxID=1736216 RepID=UPI0006F597DC|nr:hypothetical protein [Sphingomonas sp. Leaf34]KQN28119.1 hypothetical protein ASF00_09425 [Sphingomonas sp. Leaf34]